MSVGLYFMDFYCGIRIENRSKCVIQWVLFSSSFFLREGWRTKDKQFTILLPHLQWIILSSKEIHDKQNKPKTSPKPCNQKQFTLKQLSTEIVLPLEFSPMKPNYLTWIVLSIWILLLPFEFRRFDRFFCCVVLHAHLSE